MNQAIEQCRATLAAGSKSFALASKLLPAECRDDAAVVYAWCRRVDDAIDLADDCPPRQVLARLESELEAVYAGHALADVGLLAFRDVTRRRDIPVEYPRALLRGMAMDVEQVTYATLAELETYCFRVAGTVGLMMCHVMGVRDAAALRHAAELGIGMQLTNICRDVHEDWQRGRVYLPRDVLDAAGLSRVDPVSDPLSSEIAWKLRVVVHGLLNAANGYYASGDEGMSALSPRCAFAVRSARHIYSAIGDVIATQDHDVLAGRAVVSRGKKQRLVCRAGVETLWSHSKWLGRFEPAPLGDSVNHVASVFPL